MRRFSPIAVLFLAPFLLGAQGAPTPGHVRVFPPHGQPETPVAGTSAPQAAKGPAPKIYFPHPEFDFGKVDEGGDITHEFHFKNRGKGTLKISNVSTSCGCTAAVESAKEIPPGGSGTIKATYHTSGRPGLATKDIRVTSNDPKTPEYHLKLQMTVERAVEVQPEHLYMYGVKKGENRVETVRILGKAGKRLRILSVESVQHVVGVTVVALSEEKTGRSGAAVTVSLPVTQAIGPFTDNLKVKTDNPKKPELDIQVQGEVVGRVQFNPKDISFPPHAETPFTLQLTANPPQGFAIRKVESLHHLARPYIRKSTGPDGNDQYQLVVSAVTELPKDSDGKDEVDIYTNDPDQPKIAIPVNIARP